MTDWDQLRRIGDHVSPEPFESLVATAHQRDRRLRIVMGGAMLTLLTVLGIGIWMIDDDQGRTIQPVKDPSHSATPDRTKVPEGLLPLPTPDANDEAIVADAGRYRVPLNDTLSLDVDLPEKTTVNSGGLYLQLENTIVKPEVAGDTYGVPRDPCHSFNDLRPVGATVDDLVKAIREVPIYRTTRPRPVEIGGAAGQYLEVRVPAGYDASPCTDQQVGLPGNPGANNNMEPGYVGRWWILDVAGQRTVIQAFCAQCDDKTTRRTTRMVENATFALTP
jgi:hypothetical protein